MTSQKTAVSEVITSRKLKNAKLAAVAAGVVQTASEPVAAAVVPPTQAELTDPAGKASLLDRVVAEYNLNKHFRCARLVLGAQFAEGVADPDAQAAALQAAVVAEFGQFGQALGTGQTSQALGTGQTGTEGSGSQFAPASTGQEEKVTGLMLTLNRKALVFLLEARTPVIFAFMRSLAHSTLLRNPCVLHFSEDVPREFPTPLSRAFSMPADEFQAPLKGDDNGWVTLNFELVKNLLEIGHEVSPMTEEKAQEFIKLSGSRQFLAKVPSAERVVGLSQSPNVFSVQEYLHFLEAPAQLTLEAELAWPAEPYLAY